MEKQLFDKYAKLITEYATTRYMDMFREPAGNLQHKFIVPGSARYNNCLWDWDSWLTNIALRQIAPHEAIFEYEKGCIRNFFDLPTRTAEFRFVSSLPPSPAPSRRWKRSTSTSPVLPSTRSSS